MESLLGVGLPPFGTAKKECGMINFGGSYTQKTFGPNLRRKHEEIIQIINWTFMPLLWYMCMTYLHFCNSVYTIDLKQIFNNNLKSII
jgi:hypothetical protein